MARLTEHPNSNMAKKGYRPLIGGRKVFPRKPMSSALMKNLHGVNVKRTFIRCDKEFLFDPVFDEKPTLKSWLGRAKKQLLEKNDALENTDVVTRFMAFVREKLWVGPSAEQERIMKYVTEEVNLSE